MRSISRRSFLGSAAAVAVAGAGVAGMRPVAAAPMGTLVDYSAGVPSAAAIRRAGHSGVIRYVSDRRPGAEWMLGKPLRAEEVADLREAGLSIVSNYQFGKGETSDWRGGRAAGEQHAERGLELHRSAGGPEGAPIYVSIDSNPTEAEFDTMIEPYLRGWESVLGAAAVGVYANAPTIDRALAAGRGAWFWQHDWGTPEGYVHPSAHLHQFEIDDRTIDGIGVDLNSVLQARYGQW